MKIVSLRAGGVLQWKNPREGGDSVVVLTGRDKGKRGTVTARVDKEHVLVDGVNRVKKHMKPNPMKNQPGGIVDKDMPIHISNVGIYNPQTQEGRSRGLQDHRGQGLQGARVQVQRRDDRRLGRQ